MQSIRHHTGLCEMCLTLKDTVAVVAMKIFMASLETGSTPPHLNISISPTG